MIHWIPLTVSLSLARPRLYCTYCIRLCLILAEARVPFELILIDHYAKPQWFRDAATETRPWPCRARPVGWTAENGRGFCTCWSAVGQSVQVARIARQRGPLSLKDAETLCGEADICPSSAAGCSEVSTPRGKAYARQQCLERAGVLPEEYMSKSDDELSVTLGGRAAEAVTELEGHITALSGTVHRRPDPRCIRRSRGICAAGGDNLLESGHRLDGKDSFDRLEDQASRDT